MLLRAALALRSLMLVAAAGAVLGAVLMFCEAGLKLAGAARSLVVDHAGTNVTAAVLRATDGFLFGVVLLVFAGAIAFGFALRLSDTARARLPGWMRLSGIGEIKHALIEVVLVYLVVDFATDMAETEEHRSWQMLVLPVAILLIAAALRCCRVTRPRRRSRSADAGEAGSQPPSFRLRWARVRSRSAFSLMNPAASRWS